MKSIARSKWVILWLTLAFSTLFGAPQTLIFNGYPLGFNDGQSFVGTASGTLAGAPIDMFCVDPLHQVTAGDQWIVNAVSLANSTILDGVLGLTTNDFRAMFLLGGMFTNTNQATDVSLQHQIWSFADPVGYPLSPSQQAQKQSMLALVGSYNFDNAYILVPTGEFENARQIFATGTADPIPEGDTIFLVALGLVLVRLSARA